MTCATPWLTPPAVLELPDNEVQVWRAELELARVTLEPLQQALSPDEQAKAARFHFEKDRRHYTAARGSLRTLLGRYLHCNPAEIQFSYNQFGKPELALDSGQPPLRFNLAHSHGLALFAFNRGREIGIDVEWMRPDFAVDAVAQRFFAPTETAALRSLAEELRPRAFFNCWTRKEAFIKARGLGLSMSLNKFAVTLAPGEPPALLSLQDDPQAPSRWTFGELDAGDGYAAAVAVEGRDWKLKCFRT